MAKFEIIITAEEEKALLTDMTSIQEWIENAISNKARHTIDTLILLNTKSNPNKLTQVEKNALIKDMTLETAAEREVRLKDNA